MKEPKRPVLAHGKVRHVGDAYAVVVAETLEQARDAAAAIEADIDRTARDRRTWPRRWPMPRNRVHDEIAEQRLLRLGLDRGQPRGGGCGFCKRPRMSPRWNWSTTVWCRTRWSRAPRIGEYDPGTGDYKLYTTSQNPHLTRLLIAAFVMGIPENKLTVIAPDVGGGFGSKIYHYGEEAAGSGGVKGAEPSGEMDGGADRKSSCRMRMAATM